MALTLATACLSPRATYSAPEGQQFASEFETGGPMHIDIESDRYRIEGFTIRIGELTHDEANDLLEEYKTRGCHTPFMLTLPGGGSPTKVMHEPPGIVIIFNTAAEAEASVTLARARNAIVA